MIISGEDESNSICWHFHISIISSSSLSEERMFLSLQINLTQFLLLDFFTKAISLLPLQFITSIIMEKKHGGSSVVVRREGSQPSKQCLKKFLLGERSAVMIFSIFLFLATVFFPCTVLENDLKNKISYTKPSTFKKTSMACYSHLITNKAKEALLII